MKKTPDEMNLGDESTATSASATDEMQVLYGSPEILFPQDNENEDLYGPPSFFGMPSETETDSSCTNS